MGKRDRDEDINVDDLLRTLDFRKGVRDAFLGLNDEELALVLADIANHAGLSNAAFKKARSELPSFSDTRWTEYAQEFGLPEQVEDLSLEGFKTPTYWLPPSLHRSMFENVWCWQDVYREKVDQAREATSVRLLEPYLVPIIALFHGRIFDKPEQTMRPRKYSSGGGVEHEFFMIGGILFLVIELKHRHLDANNLSHLFLELLSAAEMNSGHKFSGLRVYGLLTDLVNFKVYSYNPSTRKFAFDEQILINIRRPEAATGMVDVVNKIFGLVLSAYIDGLRAILQVNHTRAKSNDFSLESSAPALKHVWEAAEVSDRKSTPHWEVALELAISCVEKLKEPAHTLQDIEERGNLAIELLTRSVRSIPRPGAFSGGDVDPPAPAEVKAMAAKIVDEKYALLIARAAHQ
ncbi:hypothetical protein M413DRAFT_112482 [Hebeloma cylindrosporum]|uniref:Uncharacterized protein n=1 Tax=Hebeloma cylindrosporum TaxID=76867 RepID=A0A0C3CLQ1_HEBCY|nr:hypothetical protein M413DRAFT_112482 [Hebeloma cylindrosporum h7]